MRFVVPISVSQIVLSSSAIKGALEMHWHKHEWDFKADMKLARDTLSRFAGKYLSSNHQEVPVKEEFVFAAMKSFMANRPDKTKTPLVKVNLYLLFGFACFSMYCLSVIHLRLHSFRSEYLLKIQVPVTFKQNVAERLCTVKRTKYDVEYAECSSALAAKIKADFGTFEDDEVSVNHEDVLDILLDALLAADQTTAK